MCAHLMGYVICNDGNAKPPTGHDFDILLNTSKQKFHKNTKSLPSRTEDLLATLLSYHRHKQLETRCGPKRCTYSLRDDSKRRKPLANVCKPLYSPHYCDVIMGAIASQITSLTIVYSTVYSDANQRKHQRSASPAFVRGIHRRPVNSPHKRPVTRKVFPFDDVIMLWSLSMSNVILASSCPPVISIIPYEYVNPAVFHPYYPQVPTLSTCNVSYFIL